MQKLIDIGKEKGYLLYDEVSDLLPPEISASAEDLDDLFSAFGTAGIEVIDAEDERFAGLDKIPGEKEFKEIPEGEVELDLTPGALEKKKDPSIIKDILQFRDEELTDDKIGEKLQESLDIIGQIDKTYKKVNTLRMKLDGMGSKEKKASLRRALWN